MGPKCGTTKTEMATERDAKKKLESTRGKCCHETRGQLESHSSAMSGLLEINSRTGNVVKGEACGRTN